MEPKWSLLPPWPRSILMKVCLQVEDKFPKSAEERAKLGIQRKAGKEANSRKTSERSAVVLFCSRVCLAIS